MPALPRIDLQAIFTQLEPVWPALAGARLFVTGGTGFFGQWLLESFLDAYDRGAHDARVTVLTRDASGFTARAPQIALHRAVTLHAGDVTSFTFPDGAFSHVIHAATPGTAHQKNEHPADLWRVIVDGTQRVLDFARQAGIQRLLFTSSGAVYGRQPSDLPYLPEDYPGGPDPLNPASTYGEGKRAAELLCTLAGQEGNLAVVMARCFALIGPALPLDQGFAAGNFLRDALHEGPICVNGDGTPYRSYLYAADLAVWLWTLLLRGVNGRAYNVGSEDALSIAELARRIAALCQPAAEIVLARVPDASRPPERYVPSTARAAAELGLRPTVGLDEGLQRTFAWYRHE